MLTRGTKAWNELAGKRKSNQSIISFVSAGLEGGVLSIVEAPRILCGRFVRATLGGNKIWWENSQVPLEKTRICMWPQEWDSSSPGWMKEPQSCIGFQAWHKRTFMKFLQISSWALHRLTEGKQRVTQSVAQASTLRNHSLLDNCRTMPARWNCRLTRSLLRRCDSSFKEDECKCFASFLLHLLRLIWIFKVLKADAQHSKPETGCLAYGIFMDGARTLSERRKDIHSNVNVMDFSSFSEYKQSVAAKRLICLTGWDDTEGVIAESLPKVLFSHMASPAQSLKSLELSFLLLQSQSCSAVTP